MKPQLKRLTSPDVDLASFSPADADYGFLLEAYIGPSDSAQDDQFQFLVGTAHWLAERSGRSLYFGRDTIVMARFDLQALRELLEAMLATVQGTDWTSIAEHIDRFGIWEYRDYVAHGFRPELSN